MPSPALAPFVRCYSYIEFDTKGLEFKRPTNARHEMVMTFNFKAKPSLYINSTLVQSFENNYGGVIGLYTQPQGNLIFNGGYVFFEIMFKPNGFYKIFRLPPQAVNNQMVIADEIFESGVKLALRALP